VKCVVQVTLHLMVTQSLRLGVEPLVGLMPIFYIRRVRSLCICHGAPSLARGRVCQLSVC